MNATSEKLFAELNNLIKIKDYPNGIKPVPKDRISGTAFFPGGDGLYKLLNKNPEFPFNKIMILGQDFDNESNFYESFKTRSELERTKKKIPNTTWVNLLKILDEINEEIKNECFFTNAIMGLRDSENKNTGKSISFQNDNYLKKCREFFLCQVKEQKPKVIICLGIVLAEFLSELSDDLKELKGKDSFAKLDLILPKVPNKISFKEIENYKTNIIFIIP